MGTSFDLLHVFDAMHPGLVTCSPDASLRTVARMMATYRVHAVLVSAHGGKRLPDGSPWGVVSDADLLRAADGVDLDEQAASTIAATPLVTVSSSDALGLATRLMVEHEVSHLLVLDPASGRPIGVLSTLDVARALAGFPERHPAGA